MANPLMTVTAGKALSTIGSTTALAVLSEGISLCHSIIEYRKTNMQVNLAREQMHAQADLALAEIQTQFDKDMAILKTLAKGYKLTLKNIQSSQRQHADQLTNLSQQINQTLAIISSPEVDSNIKLALQSTLTILMTQQQELLTSFVAKNDSPVNAFAILADSLQTSPRLFIDVS